VKLLSFILMTSYVLSSAPLCFAGTGLRVLIISSYPLPGPVLAAKKHSLSAKGYKFVTASPPAYWTDEKKQELESQGPFDEIWVSAKPTHYYDMDVYSSNYDYTLLDLGSFGAAYLRGNDPDPMSFLQNFDGHRVIPKPLPEPDDFVRRMVAFRPNIVEGGTLYTSLNELIPLMKKDGAALKFVTAGVFNTEYAVPSQVSIKATWYAEKRLPIGRSEVIPAAPAKAFLPFFSYLKKLGYKNAQVSGFNFGKIQDLNMDGTIIAKGGSDIYERPNILPCLKPLGKF